MFTHLFPPTTETPGSSGIDLTCETASVGTQTVTRRFQSSQSAELFTAEITRPSGIVADASSLSPTVAIIRLDLAAEGARLVEASARERRERLDVARAAMARVGGSAGR